MDKVYIRITDKTNKFIKTYGVFDAKDEYILSYLKENGAKFKVISAFETDNFSFSLVRVFAIHDKKFREVADKIYDKFVLTHDKNVIDEMHSIIDKFSN